jgi:tRNA(fMet)-specific endonuclease VapC
LFDQGHAKVCQEVLAHPIHDLALTVITAEESISGWYTQLRRAKTRKNLESAYLQLTDTIQALSRWRILPFTEAAMDRYDRLKAMKLGVRAADLRIAAITLEHGGVLVTRNLRDFQRIPSIAVVDWAS